MAPDFPHYVAQNLSKIPALKNELSTKDERKMDEVWPDKTTTRDRPAIKQAPLSERFGYEV